MKKRLLLMIIGIAMIINCSVSVSAETTSNYNIVEGDIKQLVVCPHDERKLQ